MNFNTDLASFRQLPLDFSLLPPDEKILVAVSGGADSLALLGGLLAAERELTVAHVNHGLRGEASDDDEKFVRECGAHLGVKCVATRLQVLATGEKVDEASLRAARYAALLQIARENGCTLVATGHTASDQLETALLHWLREGAVSGLAGMPSRRVLNTACDVENPQSVLLVRPLLNATRDEVRAVLQNAGWSWREDASNAEAQYRRNRVRHELLPLLSQIAGRNEATLARQTVRACQIWRDDLDFLESAAQCQLEKMLLREDESETVKLLVLDGVGFRQTSAALQRRIVRAAVQRVAGEVRDLSFERVEEARRHIVENRRRAVWQWRHGVQLEWTGSSSGNRLRFSRVKSMVKRV